MKGGSKLSKGRVDDTAQQFYDYVLDMIVSPPALNLLHVSRSQSLMASSSISRRCVLCNSNRPALAQSPRVGRGRESSFNARW